MDVQAIELALECARRHRGCAYVAAALYNWLRAARYIKVAFLVLPVVLAGLASWKIYDNGHKIVPVLLAGAAGLLPTVYQALKLDTHLAAVRKQAAEYTNLRDRFREAALVSSRGPIAEFQSEAKKLFDRMDTARREGITFPKRYFRRAERDIARGDYRDLLKDDREVISFLKEDRLSVLSNRSGISK